MRKAGSFQLLGLTIAAFAGVLGCSEASGEGSSAPDPDIATAPDFPSGQGQPEKGTAAYPAGPYGIGKDSIIANYQFVGFANYQIVNDAMQPIQLADFYNPHADDSTYTPADADHDDRLFPAGSVYGAGTKKPTALLIDVASVWCAPCNHEAGKILPGLHATYKPLGGEFLIQLADGPNPGEAATPKNLSDWTKKYAVDYPAAIDPTYKLGALFDQNAFPANMIIDTRTMEIVEVVSGAPDPSDPNDAFWPSFEKVLGL
jgi:hypothetical protein